MELIFCCVKERDDLMVNIIKEDLDIEETLKKKLEFICSFSNTGYEIKKGSIRNDDNQNNYDYNIYKLAQIIAMNNSIKTHSNLFLAKYYLYKLLACWSFLYIFIVIIYNYNFSHPILLIIGLIIIFFSFNEKYKLYKKLNGNELITGLYYSLFKNLF